MANTCARKVSWHALGKRVTPQASRAWIHSPRVRLTVVVLDWRDQQQTLRCAQAVSSCGLSRRAWSRSTMNGARLRAVSSRSRCRERLSSRVNLGYAGGNNLGIKRALGDGTEFILLMN